MKTLSKFMATTAICSFIAGTAAAQGLSADVDADVGVTSDTSIATETEGSTGLAIESKTGVTAGTDAEATTTATPTMTSTPDSATMAVITAVTDAMESGQSVTVLSADGQVLGEAETATQDSRGAAELSINLDQTLATDANRVTFSGTADVDAQGRIVLPLAEADFISRVTAHTDGSAG